MFSSYKNGQQHVPYLCVTHPFFLTPNTSIQDSKSTFLYQIFQTRQILEKKYGKNSFKSSKIVTLNPAFKPIKDWLKISMYSFIQSNPNLRALFANCHFSLISRFLSHRELFLLVSNPSSFLTGFFSPIEGLLNRNLNVFIELSVELTSQFTNKTWPLGAIK